MECLTKLVEQSIKATAERKHDQCILLKVLAADLVAREAHYHPHLLSEGLHY